MTAFRLTDGQRLDVLAAVVLDHLDETHSESELELGGSATDLYNLAAALTERKSDAGRVGIGAEHADELATNAIAHAGDAGRLRVVRDAILRTLGLE